MYVYTFPALKVQFKKYFLIFFQHLESAGSLIPDHTSHTTLIHPVLEVYNYTGCPNKHGNSVTNSISSLFRISIVIPNFKSNGIIIFILVYFMKR